MDRSDASVRSVPGQDGPVSHVPLRRSTSAEVWRQATAIPNLLTYLRFVAVPVFVWAFHRGFYEWAFALFVGAAFTDGLDGLLARALHQQTRLGGIIDPIADKLLTLAAVVSLVVHARIPVWLLGLLILRDACLASAVLVLRLTRRPVKAAPTRLGKYSTFVLAVALTLALVRESRHTAALDGYIAVFLVLAAQCVIVSTVQYFLRWRRLMKVPV